MEHVFTLASLKNSKQMISFLKRKRKIHSITKERGSQKIYR